MPEPIVFALLLVAVVAGFVLGRWTGRKGGRPEPGAGGKGSDTPWLRQSYFEGLNYLLNEQPDAAIDTFVTALEVNSDTLETHFALGNLLRRRGEVDRAIRVHQNLLARPSLTPQQQQQAQVELALDYMKSGLLDRAEALFKELLGSSDLTIRGLCLERLVDIYRDENEWEKAIAMAEQLCHRKLGRNIAFWRELQAHFSCELAEQAMRSRDYVQARQWIRKALGFDRESVRAYLDLALVEMAQDDCDSAIRSLKKIPSSSPLYISEALPLIHKCYRQLARLDVFRKLLQELYGQEPSEILLQHLAQVIFTLEGEFAARGFLIEELPHFVSLAPMGEVLGIVEHQSGCEVDYGNLASVLDKMLAREGAYECRQCGFTGQQLHWCCPSCKSWGSMIARFTSSGSYLETPPAI